MKRTPKPVFFIVALLIFALAYTSIFGVYSYYGDRRDTIIRGASDIRTGIDIRGGVEVTFVPEKGTQNVTNANMDAVNNTITRRLIAKGITDYEVYTDYDNEAVIVRFPWQSGEKSFDAKTAIEELGTTASLEFYIDTQESTGANPTEKPGKTDLILTGKMVKSATATLNQEDQTPAVSLALNDTGKTAFATATKKQFDANTAANSKTNTISIWLDNTCISNPSVSAHITDGNASISGGFSNLADASKLANLINSGALPFSITATNAGSVSPTLGEKALDIMVLAGGIAMILVALFMIITYRLPGFVAVLALIGQVSASLAVVSHYFGFLESFTLTLPGIAGIILSVGIGVDANVISAERIKENIRLGKTIDTAVASGFSKSVSAVIDGNIVVMLVSIVLMGVFGPSDSLWAKVLWPIMHFFPVSTSGTVYSFGYTLMAGAIFNLIFGVVASRLMLKSVSRLKFLRKPCLYGGKKNDEQV